MDETTEQWLTNDESAASCVFRSAPETDKVAEGQHRTSVLFAFLSALLAAKLIIVVVVQREGRGGAGPGGGNHRENTNPSREFGGTQFRWTDHHSLVRFAMIGEARDTARDEAFIIIESVRLLQLRGVATRSATVSCLHLPLDEFFARLPEKLMTNRRWRLRLSCFRCRAATFFLSSPPLATCISVTFPAPVALPASASATLRVES